MNKKNIIFFISAAIVFVLIIVLFSIIFSNQNNRNYDIKKSNIKIDQSISKTEQEHKEISVCAIGSDCLKKNILGCNKNLGYFSDKDTKLMYFANIEKQDGNCLIVIKGLDQGNLNERVYCVVSLEKINDAYYDNLLHKNIRDNNIDCKKY